MLDLDFVKLQSDLLQAEAEISASKRERNDGKSKISVPEGYGDILQGGKDADNT